MATLSRMQLFASVLFLLLYNGCLPTKEAILKIKIDKAKEHNPSKTFKAGAAKIDITPVPGYPMGGYAVSARTSRGWWTRLYARAIYLEDSTGTPLFLVSCDLWAMPGGLADIVAQCIQKKYPFIGRENIIIAATHTHQSPGNFSTSEFYNSFGSHKKGFDYRLFDFLKSRITESMIKAYENKKECTMKAYSTKVHNVVRNRSYPAFLYNPESMDIINNNKDIPLGKTSAEYPDSMAFRAVIPELKVLRFDPAGSGKDPVPIAIAAFFAAHPNSLGSMPEVYNSGLFGVTSTLIEQHFAETITDTEGYHIKDRSVLVFFNGAEGDVSPIWEKQDRQTTIKLGKILADSLLQVIRTPVKSITFPSISLGFRRFSIADTFFTDSSGRKYYTDKRAVPGDPLLGGAEDGRSFAYHLGFVEGLKGERSTLQGSKKIVFDNALYPDIMADIIEKLVRDPLIKNAPKYISLGVYQLNDIVICTVPGEFTTTLGYRLEQAISQSFPKIHSHPKVILIGLANEYLSYFTTPEEYEAQHYEGASTLYGPASGPLIVNLLKSISDSQLNGYRNFSENFNYSCGEPFMFGMTDCQGKSFNSDDGLENIAQDERGNPKRDFPKCSWTDDVLKLSKKSGKNIIPGIIIETRQESAKTWKPLLLNESGFPADAADSIKISETDRGLNIVTVSNYEKESGKTSWTSIWMTPANLYKKMAKTNYEFRFCIFRDEKLYVSPAFRLNENTLIEAKESYEKIAVHLSD